MKFSEVVDQTAALLQRNGRVSYRALKVEFDLDDDRLEILKEELIDILELATDKDGKMLVWLGESQSVGILAQPQPQSPASYTPRHLAERILAEQAEMELRGATDGERKTITALFADLKGSTTLIEGLDPEDARAIIDPALRLMMDAVHRYDGYVAQALGDGIFALFGAPIAREDHPQRALYAALRMQDEMRHFSDELRRSGQAPLQMRVGVNTGEVVVRSIRKDDLHTDYVPVGHSTNIAARMEQLANPGSILVTEQTHKLTEGYFEFKALGEIQIKGVEGSLNAFEVVRAGPLRTRLQISARRGLSRFVGRHKEIDQLQQALEQAKGGHGQIVGVMGEPGLGKSRLFHEFKLASQSGCLILEVYSVSHGKSTPYLPVVELLKNYFQIKPADDERTRREKIGGKMLMLDRGLEDALPYFFTLLGIEDPTASLQQMDQQVRRQRTLDALKRLLLRESLNQPVMVIFEDLHWIDQETQAFLDTLSSSIASASIALLVNYRPEYHHEWGGKTYYTQLRLTPLGKEEAGELLTFLMGDDSTLDPLKALILDRTDGTPFFMEEVVETLAEERVLLGDRSRYRVEETPNELHISPSVQGVLAARIDRLERDEKALLQQLAVVGRTFPLGLVREVVSQSEGEIHRLLSSLQAKEFLYEQPAVAEVEYIFKHALTQEVAYGTVLLEQRKVLHKRTGQAMEALYAGNLGDHYGELANHYKYSDEAEKAVEYLDLAGRQAMQRSAYEEAVSFLTQELDLLQTLPDTPRRARRELRAQTNLGKALQVTESAASPAAERTYTRALALCQQVNEPEYHLQVQGALCTLYLVRGELEPARETAEQCLVLSKPTGDSALLLLAHSVLGMTLYFQGDFSPAQKHLNQGIQLYDPRQHAEQSISYPYGMDPGAMCLAYEANVLCHLGYLDQGRQRLRQAMAVAQAADPYTLAATLYNAACHHFYRREAHAAQTQAEAVIELSNAHEFPYWGGWAATVRGWAQAAQGQGEAGVTEIHRGMAGWRDTGAKVGSGWALALLAEAYATVGRIQEGLDALTEAVGEYSTPFFQAEVYRLRGDLLLQLGSAESEAESSFTEAIEIARQQQAKSWELRAATSLARLWQRHEKQGEAHNLLAPVYGWFTEGFGTKDLQEAKIVLEGLR